MPSNIQVIHPDPRRCDCWEHYGTNTNPFLCFELNQLICVRESLFCVRARLFAGHPTVSTRSVATMNDVEEERKKGRQARADNAHIDLNDRPDGSIDVIPRWID